MRIVGDGALLASLSKATGTGHARHRRDHPARAGRGDPLPRLRRDDRDRRPGHRQDRGGPAPGGVPALLRPQPVRRRRHPGGRPVRRVRRTTSRRCCPRWARTPRRCGRSVRWWRATTPTGSTRRAVAAIKGSLRMRRVLERASHDAVPGGPTELRLLYRGTLLRLDAARPGPDPAAGAAPRGPAQRGPRRRLRRRLRRAVGAGPRAEDHQPAGEGRTSRPSWPTAATSGTSSRPGGRGSPRCGCCAGWPTRRGCGRTPTGSCRGRRSRRCRARSTAAEHGRRSPTWRCWTNWTS